MNNATGRIDFHLHSYASNVTDYYAANAFAIPESYSDPTCAVFALEGTRDDAHHVDRSQLDRRSA